MSDTNSSRLKWLRASTYSFYVAIGLCVIGYLVLQKMCLAIKDNGVIYTSFKYSDFEGERGGRYYTDFTEVAFKEFIAEISELRIEDYWITGDVRSGRDEEKWLNLILRKSDIL